MGFSVYAGTALTAMFRQNDVCFRCTTYIFIPGQVTRDRCREGQKPDFVAALARTLLRKGLRRWQGT